MASAHAISCLGTEDRVKPVGSTVIPTNAKKRPEDTHHILPSVALAARVSRDGGYDYVFPRPMLPCKGDTEKKFKIMDTLP